MKKVVPSTLPGRFFYHLSFFRFHIVLALVIMLIGLVAYTLFSYVSRVTPRFATHKYLVAAEDLPAGSKVEADKIARVPFVDGYTPKNAIPAENMQTVIGKYTLIPFSRGDVLTPWFLGKSPEGTPMELSSQLEASKKLFYLKKGDIQTPPASLSLYDTIDFYVSQEASAGAVLRNIQVIDLGESEGGDSVIGVALSDSEIRTLVNLLAKKTYLQIVVLPKPKNETSKLTK